MEFDVVVHCVCGYDAHAYIKVIAFLVSVSFWGLRGEPVSYRLELTQWILSITRSR